MKIVGWLCRKTGRSWNEKPASCPVCERVSCLQPMEELERHDGPKGVSVAGVCSPLAGRPIYQIDDLSLCVHPHEREKEMKRYADMGCPTEITPTGGIVFRSKQHKERVIALNRQHHKGYAPATAGHSREKYERALRG